MRHLAGYGIRPVALNFRGRSGEPNRTAGAYHAGRTDDVGRVFDWLRHEFPGNPLVGLGFSLGGNALLKYLAEEGSPRLIAAGAVSVPFDLAVTADAMESGLGRLYGRYFLRSLLRSLRAKATRYPELVDLDRIRDIRTIRDFDERYTAPIHGFGGASDYYTRCSSGPLLDRVGVPTVLIQSRDDPLVPATTIPDRLIRRNPRLVPWMTDRGGHVGFIAAGGKRPRCWAESAAAGFLSDVIARAGPSRVGSSGTLQGLVGEDRPGSRS